MTHDALQGGPGSNPGSGIGEGAANTEVLVGMGGQAVANRPDSEAELVRRGELAALRDVETAAREIDALLGGERRRWTLDGRKVTEDAALPLLSLHDYLNDVRVVREGVRRAAELPISAEDFEPPLSESELRRVEAIEAVISRQFPYLSPETLREMAVECLTAADVGF